MPTKQTQSPMPAPWQEILRKIQEPGPTLPETRTRGARAGKTAIYLLDPARSQQDQRFTIDFWASETEDGGSPADPTPVRLTLQDLESYSSIEDREILMILSAGGFDEKSGSIPLALEENVLERLVSFRRLYLAEPPSKAEDESPRRKDSQSVPGSPLTLEAKEAGLWGFKLSVIESEDGYRFQGWFQRRQGDGVQLKPLEQARCVIPRGWVVFKDHISRLDPRAQWAWLQQLRDYPDLLVPKEDGLKLAEALISDPFSPQIELPPSLEWRQITANPKPMGVFIPDERDGAHTGDMLLKITFDYEGRRISPSQAGATLLLKKEKLSIKRDLTREELILSELSNLKLEPVPPELGETDLYRIDRDKFASVVQALMALNWQIFAKDSPIRKAKSLKVSVKAREGGFDFEGRAEYESGSVSLPALVNTLKAGEPLIRLGDGDWGMPPMEWLKRYTPLNEFNDKPSRIEKPIHFSKSQGVLLDAWLKEEKDLVVDDAFEDFRDKLKDLQQLDLVDPPKTFKGTLRNYQKEGLSWLCNLSNLGIGGILADDMGLGKTIQLLAFLETRRKEFAPKHPSLIVVPKSLVANWVEEAQKFAPKLRVLPYHGIKRHPLISKFRKHDLIVTTYNTLRLDIERLKDFTFDCAVIDEAQSIKNSKSLVSKAVKLVKARWRLALTGTPIENDITDLFSIVEFANPGLLRKKLQDRFLKQYHDPEVLEALSRAFKPFILRRTKEQVLTELPKKTEQTLFCELSPHEQKVYDDLKNHYRHALQKSIHDSGLAKSKMQVLEALLRLRQAACHPGLLDKSKIHAKSAKVDLLVGQVKEIIQGGSKILVFSQFVSLLTIVRARLDTDKIVYEYLDGTTTDRQERVKNFQNNDKIKVFLISLKAGGVGLNLTKASYVFLLDPWWNPAVEAQAVDRTHRMGQKNRVFAYRLVAKGTVEEKILELQKDKRKLADSIINADSSMLKTLRAEDLNLLLS